MAKRYKIFVINLDRSVSRWEKMHDRLEALGLPYERIPAVDGKNASDEFLNKYYSAELNRKKYYACMSAPEIACYISHLKACERVMSEDLDYAIILEDDIILEEPFKFVPLALESITCDWNYIKLIAPFKKKKIVSREPVVFEIPVACSYEKWAHDGKTDLKCVSKYSNLISVPTLFELVRWRKPPAGTQAYAVSKDGAGEFIAKRSRFFRPIDVDLQFTWETGLEIAGLLPVFCKLSDETSEIGDREKIYHYPLAHLIYKIKYFIHSLYG